MSTRVGADSLALRRKRNAKNLALQLGTPAIAMLKHSGQDHYFHSAPSTPTAAMPFTPISADTGAIGYYESTYRVQPMEILPNLYLGDENNAANMAVLKRLGIQYILNVAREVENPFRNRATSLNAVSTLDSAASRTSSCRPTRAASVDTHSVPVSEESEDPEHITYKKFSWTHSQDNLDQYFEHAFAYIDQARDAGKAVLVHCQLGVSRSASLVIAYVMRSLRLTTNEAYKYVKSKSPNVCPNLNLMYQLMDLEKSLGLAKPATTYPVNDVSSTTTTTPVNLSPVYTMKVSNSDAHYHQGPDSALSVGSYNTCSPSVTSSSQSSPVSVGTPNCML
ncbi:tyrosine/serine/threonine protein phosphatase [Dispira simplex]|nr:tyrosine/serine/threonine protein phosphatase [Dispira simplex]